MRYVHRAVFLDRDGTLIRDKKYAHRPAEIELLDGVVPGLKLLQRAGYHLIVVTNQSGVARGLFKEADVNEMHEHLRQLLLAEGVDIAGFYYCPHHPEGVVPDYTFRCDCRKPAPGLILRASAEKAISLPQSWLIGDLVTDIEAGLAAGCNTILIQHDQHGFSSQSIPPQTKVVGSFASAVQIILSHRVREANVRPSGHRATIRPGTSTGSW